MLDRIWPYLGDLHQVLPTHWAGVVSTVAAILCGGLIGAERQRADKPAGLRTLVLICLGAAIFTQASVLLAGEGVASDRTRIAAQIVSGIGFLGAGAIIRERGMVIGVTTGAGIWATAAVGVILGGGYIAAGVFFTLLVVATLGTARLIDRIAVGPCRFQTLHLTFDPDHGKTRLRIQSILDRHQQEADISLESEAEGAPGEARIRFCHVHRDHRLFLNDLIKLDSIQDIRQG